MRRVLVVGTILLVASSMWYLESRKTEIKRVPALEITKSYPIAPMPREANPDWVSLHKDAKNGKVISGAVTLSFPEGGFADLYLVDGDKEVRFQTIGSYLAEEDAHYAVDFRLGLREFDTVTPNMKLVVRGSNIAGRKPENPRIIFSAYEIDEGKWFKVK